MGISNRSTTEVEENNKSALKAGSALLAKKRTRVTEKEENVRLLNGFVARTRWEISVARATYKSETRPPQLRIRRIWFLSSLA